MHLHDDGLAISGNGQNRLSPTRQNGTPCRKILQSGKRCGTYKIVLPFSERRVYRDVRPKRNRSRRIDDGRGAVAELDGSVVRYAECAAASNRTKETVELRDSKRT